MADEMIIFGTEERAKLMDYITSKRLLAQVRNLRDQIEKYDDWLNQIGRGEIPDELKAELKDDWELLGTWLDRFGVAKGSREWRNEKRSRRG